MQEFEFKLKVKLDVGNALEVDRHSVRASLEDELGGAVGTLYVDITDDESGDDVETEVTIFHLSVEG